MRRFRIALLGACAAALALAATTFAGSGVGDVFNLGQTNSVDASSALTGAPATATAMLDVRNGSALGGSFAVLGRLTSSSSPSKSGAVRGVGLGQARGVWGTGSNGPGVYGNHSGSSGQAPAVLGETGSTTGGAVGAAGRVTSPSAGAYSAGVKGENSASATGDTYGVYGGAVAGVGVYGRGGSGGVSAYSDYGYGVQAVSARNWGVLATTGGDGRFAVFGSNTSSSTAAGGVYGSGPNSIGVRGTSTTYSGVVGESIYGSGVVGNSRDGTGVYGYSANGSAGYFEGDVTVSGTLHAGAKQFRIDDPLDPAHKYLQHTSVESSDMLDLYAGNVVTDARGFATVRLPKWFMALNRSFRYQLTSLTGLQKVAVAKEIAHNRFTIQTEKPHTKVSWQVTGIRHDPYANAHRTVVVVPKPAADQGKYLNPQLYGKPMRRAIGFHGRRTR